MLLIAPHAMLGRAWRELLDARGLDYQTAARPALDLTKPDTIAEHISDGTDVVINSAAWTDVDGAETHEDEATAVNGTGVAALAERCREVGALLVHYSTDYVFDGTATEPYEVDHPRHPLNAYGRSKAVGEEAIENSGCEYLLIRTSWLYAPWGKNFVLTMAKLTAEKESLRVVADQRGRPTSCVALAENTMRLIDAGARGTYHLTDGGDTTWHGLTQAINNHLAHTCDIHPCTTADFPRPAPRPAYSVLSLAKAEDILDAITPWERSLAQTLDRITGSAGLTG